MEYIIKNFNYYMDYGFLMDPGMGELCLEIRKDLDTITIYKIFNITGLEHDLRYVSKYNSYIIGKLVYNSCADFYKV